MKPACHVRTLDGQIDWAEDCISDIPMVPSNAYTAEDGYGSIPLYAIPEGWVMVPKAPTDAMLRPFMDCPDDELRLAWEAMLRIVLSTVPVVEIPPVRGSSE